MKHALKIVSAVSLGLAVAVGVISLGDSATAEPPDEARTAAAKSFSDGNWNDALGAFKQLLAGVPTAHPDDLRRAVDCLNRLGRVEEFDELVEDAVRAEATSWGVVWAAGQAYLGANHYGSLIAGEFSRGQRQGGGKWVNAIIRDRIRALQLMERAVAAARGDTATRPQELADLYLQFAAIISRQGNANEAWRLQVLSDLSELPDYEEVYYGRQSPGAPVDANGNAVFFEPPKSYAEAASDGEKWRWLMVEAVEADPGVAARVDREYADFLHGLLGTQTMGYGWGYQGAAGRDEGAESGTYALHTLGEDETIARLATGIKRFDLPNRHNFIRIYKRLAKGRDGHAEAALEKLAQIFENRRQYPTAAGYWKDLIERFGPGHSDYRKQRLAQIVDNWGQFESHMSHVAGHKATVDFKFRNGTSVSFTAHRVKVAELLADAKAYLKTNPAQLEWAKIQVDRIGYRLVTENEDKYIGAKVASWDLKLAPAPDHFDRRTTVQTPLDEAGVYLLTSQMRDGNTSRIIVWLNDTVIVRKQLHQKTYYFVADALTGAPVAKANLEFFGYRQQYRERSKWLPGRRHDILVSNFAELSDADGQVMPDPKELSQGYNWLVTATTEGGRLAYLGFSGVWSGNYYDAEYKATKVYTITDRPVYRPKQTVKFKFWVRHAQYDKEDTSQFAGQTFTVLIQDPKGDKILEKACKADAYGGFEGEYALPADATLGQYRLSLANHGGGGHFRVEEYKKPEFEVSVDAPAEPVMLGEAITATVKAKYYFGSPVTKATVKYKVQRTAHSANWYPAGIWDWFYGRGYWWYGYDCGWLSGWDHWGIGPPRWWWWPMPHQPPELVSENEVPIGPDGTIEITIDTAVTKELHGDTDHRYEITAEVVDESRRTIVGTGAVLVARKPFQVYAWVDRGHYRSGDVVKAEFSAQTLDSRPVKGKGKLILYRITYDDGKPLEKAVQRWALHTDAEGRTRQQLKAANPGQYRLSYLVTDSAGHEIEGGYVFCVRGKKFADEEFRFNEVELVPDKREYRPGEVVELMVNTDREDATVLLFLRPANGIYLPPKIVRMQGKSVVEEIQVTKKDMPNFFVEAVTVSDGKVYSQMREIVVPPEKRVLDVAVTPSAGEYKPGEKASVRVKVTDLMGKPFVGSAVMTMYDKSVEYIAGGSNVPEIREFFWKWRRRHNPQTQSSVDRYLNVALKKGEQAMAAIGVFGHGVADMAGGERAALASREGGVRGQSKGRLQMRAMAMNGIAADAAAAPGMAAPQAAFGMALKQSAGVGGGGQGQAPVVQPVVRTKFADTAFWAGAMETDQDGVVDIELTMPENLTGWKVKTWVVGHGTRVGEGVAEVVTRKNLMLRLQAPRFFVEKDEVVLSANVHNYLKTDKPVQAVLELDGPCLEVMGKAEQTVTIEAGSEQRVDWRVKVVREGEAVVRMKALTDEESDAMQMRFPVYVHGMTKMVAVSGVIRPEEASGTFTITVPAERRMAESRLELRYSPTLAGAMVDALPYLVEYPYGCTEQTLNRFVPTVVTQKILLDMGISLEDVRTKRTNLNAQEIGDDRERAGQWQRWKRNPVFDDAEVRRMVKQGVKDLTAMQLADGGWGWFSGWGEHSYPHTTAVVVHGLQVARASDVALVPGVLERGIEWLKRYQAEQVRLLKNAEDKKAHRRWKGSADNLDAFVYMVLLDADLTDADMMDYLYRDRKNLAVYGKAVYALALHRQKQADKLAMVKQNIEQYLVQDDENQTAYLKLPNRGYWWYWYGSEIEAHAYYLKLLAATEPTSAKAAGLVKYLLNNRKHATYWNSTRDSALCIEAMADYLRASGEDKPDLTFEVLVDGRKHKEVSVNADNLFTFDNQFLLLGDAVESGEHTVEIRKKGTGPLYFNAYLSYFTLEDHITATGLEIKVERRVCKLTPEDKTVKVAGGHGQALDQKVEKYKREELADLATLKSGDLVEIELILESKNDYEYLVFEDMKAAGFEPVDVRSGYTGNSLGAYMELRDEKVAFFVRALPRGRHSVTYRLRAEIPGRFSALPARGYAMYAPELKANSDEIKLQITD